MAYTLTARTHRKPTPHTDWCSQGHRCGLDEHRGPQIVADRLGARAVTTRVRAGNVNYAEVTIRIPLARREETARHQLGTLLRLLRDLMGAVAHPMVAESQRPLLDRTINAARPMPAPLPAAALGRGRPTLDRRPAA